MWMYATPVVYPIELVPARWLPFYSLNPFVGLIQAIRWALVDVTRPTPFMLASSIVLTIVVLVGSVAFFQRAEDTFADVV
jgi:lipopolysaccharide transport system permease protein